MHPLSLTPRRRTALRLESLEASSLFSAGDPDLNNGGGDGQVLLSGVNGQAYGVAVQMDGKIVVVERRFRRQLRGLDCLRAFPKQMGFAQICLAFEPTARTNQAVGGIPKTHDIPSEPLARTLNGVIL